jgi:hypothetical protein
MEINKDLANAKVLGNATQTRNNALAGVEKIVYWICTIIVIFIAIAAFYTDYIEP